MLCLGVLTSSQRNERWGLEQQGVVLVPTTGSALAQLWFTLSDLCTTGL